MGRANGCRGEGSRAGEICGLSGRIGGGAGFAAFRDGQQSLTEQDGGGGRRPIGGRFKRRWKPSIEEGPPVVRETAVPGGNLRKIYHR